MGRLVGQLVAETHAVHAEAVLFRGPFDDEQEFIPFERFGKVVVSSLPHGPDRGFDGAESGNNHDLGPQGHAGNFLDKVKAASSRHLQVGNHHRRIVFFYHADGGIDIGRFKYHMVFGAKDIRHDVSLGIVVFYQNDGDHAVSMGSRITKQAPFPSRFFAMMEPPWASTIRFAMASPRPTPSGRFEK